MKRRLISLDEYMNESKTADRIMDLIELAQSKPNDVKIYVELATAVGLNPKNLKTITNIKHIIANNDDSLDAMNDLMELTESDNLDESKLKLMSKETWNKLSKKQREDALEQCVDDPEGIKKYADSAFDNLPDFILASMYESIVGESSYEDNVEQAKELSNYFDDIKKNFTRLDKIERDELLSALRKLSKK